MIFFFFKKKILNFFQCSFYIDHFISKITQSFLKKKLRKNDVMNLKNFLSKKDLFI